jgi:REP element-mobilizing transposase RayT
MPRKRRLFIPDIPQHEVQRGADGQPVFFSDTDCARYLNTFGEYAERRNIPLHAYCLMINHTHLLISTTEQGALSACMQEWGRKFVSIPTDYIAAQAGFGRDDSTPATLSPNVICSIACVILS